MGRGVAVVGVGMTNFGEHWKKGLKELITEAGIKEGIYSL
jgi:acetyl-CoA acetyltransferase